MPRLKPLLFWIFAFLAGLASWQLTLIFLQFDIPLRWWSFGLALGGLHTILAFSLLEGLLMLPLPEKWCYRLAFLLSAGVGVFLWARHPYAWAVIPAVLLGAFFGALIATRQHLGFWEDNHPPPKGIRSAVYRLHCDIIGQPPPVPAAKRAFDLLLSALGLLLSAPVWLLAL